MKKPNGYPTYDDRPRRGSGLSIRSCKGDVIKLTLTVVGVLCILGVAGKAWIWNDRSQQDSGDNETSSFGSQETDVSSTEIAYTYLPSKRDRHDRIHRDFFVLSERALSPDVNGVELN